MLAAAFFAAIYIAERISAGFAEWMNTNIASFMRKFLCAVFGIFPFSVFEIICALAAMLFIITCIFFIIRAIKKGSRLPAKKCLAALCIAFITVFELFTITLAPAYNAKSVSSKMALDQNISEDDIFAAFDFLCEAMQNDLDKLDKNSAGQSISPYDFPEISAKIKEACDSFAEKYPFYSHGSGCAKRLLSSKPMTYTFITGIYGFFTGESNINTNFPDLILAPAIAHEFSHARGIAPENECNFLAFAVCFSSDDAYIRYTGAAFIFDNIAAACKKADPARYKESISKIPEALIKDYAAYNEYIDQYRTPVAEMSDNINSAYLKSQGQKSGTISYSQVVELCTSYILNIIK